MLISVDINVILARGDGKPQDQSLQCATTQTKSNMNHPSE